MMDYARDKNISSSSYTPLEGRPRPRAWPDWPVTGSKAGGC